MAILRVEDGPDSGKQIQLDGEKALLLCGRQEDLDLVLTDSAVSSQHFRLVKKGHSFTVTDLGSKHGLLVDGKKTTKSQLRDGSEIQVGNTVLRLLADDAVVEEVDDEDDMDEVGLSGYKVEEMIGKGGMGVVYRARQISLDRTVALKVLSPELVKGKDFVKRFLEEARVAGSLTHSNVVQVHDVGSENGTYYIAMEYVAGGNLADKLAESPRLDVKTTVRIGLDSARALEYAESKKIVHCDIKPSNLMLTETGLAKLADLGIARRLADAQAGGLTEVLGSPQFMAPEQAQGKPMDRRTDLYALGCTLFTMLAGKPPFTGGTAREIMKKQVVEEHPDIVEINPDVPDELADIIDRLMEKRPAERFQSAQELIADLQTLQGGSARKSAGASAKAAAPAKAGPPKKPTTRAPKPATRPLKGAPAPREGGAANRLSRQRSQTSSGEFATFIAIGLGVALAVLLVALLYNQAAPDQAKGAYRDALRAYNAENYMHARSILQMRGGTTDNALAQKITALRAQIKQKLLEVQAEKQFEERWAAYQRMEARGASKRERFEELKALYDAFQSTEHGPQIRAALENFDQEGMGTKEEFQTHPQQWQRLRKGKQYRIYARISILRKFKDDFVVGKDSPEPVGYTSEDGTTITVLDRKWPMGPNGLKSVVSWYQVRTEDGLDGWIDSGKLQRKPIKILDPHEESRFMGQ